MLKPFRKESPVNTVEHLIIAFLLGMVIMAILQLVFQPHHRHE